MQLCNNGSHCWNVSIPHQQFLKPRKNMLDRTISPPFEKRHLPHRSDQKDYIKICVPEDGEMSASTGVPEEGGRGEKRFTFSKHWQDVIKEEEEEEQFCRIDCQQLIKLRKSLAAAKAQNHRLVVQSSENMELFNSYMKEMEQRLFDKNREIDFLKDKLKNVEQKAERSEERAKKVELRMVNEGNARNSTRQQFGIQCQPRVYRCLNGQQQAQRQCSDAQVKLLQKENQLIQRQISHLRQNHQNIAQSFEKEIQLRKVEQQYDSMRNHYYRTLTNSPRPSLNKNNNPVPLKLQLKNSITLNALISPRNNSLSKPPLDPCPPASRHQNILLNNIDHKFNKIVNQSSCIEGVPLQFDRAESRRLKKGGP